MNFSFFEHFDRSIYSLQRIVSGLFKLFKRGTRKKKILLKFLLRSYEGFKYPEHLIFGCAFVHF